MNSIQEAVEAGAGRLANAGVESPRRDARLLLADTLNADLGYLIGHGEAPLEEPSRGAFFERIERRARREPVSRIIGRREFWGLEFQLGPETLDPRPDSECLVAAVLERFSGAGHPLRLLDLGTGSGCLLVSILSELPKATGLGIDRAPAALRVAAGNAARLGVASRSAFAAMDWTAALSSRFDAVVANPPYLRSGEIETVAPEVSRYEPPLALDGGADGLNAYRAIVPRLRECLSEKGLAFLEVGAGQADAVERILIDQGYALSGRARDLGGHDRCVIAGVH